MGLQQSRTPVAVVIKTDSGELTELTGVSAINAGTSVTCAILTDGRVRCWGWNGNGQVGVGDATTEGVATATLVVDPSDPSGVLRGVTSIAPGDYHTCAVANERVRCWGHNSAGALGTEIAPESFTPLVVVDAAGAALSGARSVQSGASSSCAIVGPSNGVMCWGDLRFAVVGADFDPPSFSPVPVNDLANVASLSAHRFHYCAALNDGRGRCWGVNVSGELGDGTTDSVSTPTDVIVE